GDVGAGGGGGDVGAGGGDGGAGGQEFEGAQGFRLRRSKADKGPLDKNCNSLRLRKIMRQSMTTDPEGSMIRVSEGVKARLNSGEWYVACGTDGIEPLENEEREHCLVEAETFVCYVVQKDTAKKRKH
ncbi:ground-like domain protein, partial [Oesophagostomum dentatum]